VNVACAFALFGWKKWGFFGFCGTALLAVGINLAAGISPIVAVAGLVGVALVYGVLQMGGERKAWPKLN
jgi:hypothetical protein